MKQPELNISTSPESECGFNEDVQPDDLMFQVGEKAVLKRDTAFELGSGICCIARGNTVEITSVSRMFNHLYRIKCGAATTVVAECDLDKFPVDTRPVTERIKTFDDACLWCENNGKQNLTEVWCNTDFEDDTDTKDIAAYLQLRIITAALNEGWEPTDNSQIIYMPKLVNNDGSGFWTGTVIGRFGSLSLNLCFKSSILAEYAAVHFKNIYADFCGGEKGSQQEDERHYCSDCYCPDCKKEDEK